MVRVPSIANGIQENKEKWVERGESVYERTIRIIQIGIKRFGMMIENKEMELTYIIAFQCFVIW